MHTLAVCRTCPREQSRKGGLLDRLREIASAAPLPDGLRLVAAECLGGCPLPCAAAFNAPDKWRVRFTRLSAANLADLVAAAHAYVASPDGYLTDPLLPPGLRGHISARSPTHPVHPGAMPAGNNPTSA